MDFQNARRPFNNQPSQNDDDRNLDQNLSEEQILPNENGQDLSNKGNKDPERKYGSPTTTQRSVRGRKPERTTPSPVTTTEVKKFSINIYYSAIKSILILQ